MIDIQYANFVHSLCTRNGHSELEPFYECIMESTKDVLANIAEKVGENPMKSTGDKIFDTSIDAGYETIRNPEEEKSVEIKKLADKKANIAPDTTRHSMDTNQSTASQSEQPGTPDENGIMGFTGGDMDFGSEALTSGSDVDKDSGSAPVPYADEAPTEPLPVNENQPEANPSTPEPPTAPNDTTESQPE